MKTKQKKKVGRPALLIKTKKSRMVYISDEAYEFFTTHGDGNFSKGVQTVYDILRNK
jgi:uncharacterized protein (DUF4415 family)